MASKKELEESKKELGIAFKLAIMGYNSWMEENDISEEDRKKLIKDVLKEVSSTFY